MQSSHAALRATAWMLGAIVGLTLMAVSGRQLSAELNTFQILTFRSAVGLAAIALRLQRTGWSQVRTRHFGLQVLRNVLHFGGQYGWFFGLAMIPLTEVFAIEFTTPLWIALIAVTVLGERMTPTRAIGTLLGFVGVLIILRPGAGVMSIGALSVLGASFAYAFAHSITKKLAATESPLSIVFYMCAVQLPIALVPAVLSGWVWPSARAWPWIMLVALCGLGAHFCMARAFKLVDVSFAAPIDFLRLPLIAAIGYFAYGEQLDPWLLLGAAVVVTGTWLNLRSTHR